MKREKQFWITRVLPRVALYLFFFQNIVLILFVIGNFQSFLDSNLILLLKIMRTGSLLFVFVLIYDFFTQLFARVLKHKRRFATWPVILGGLAWGGAVQFISQLFLSWIRPVAY